MKGKYKNLNTMVVEYVNGKKERLHCSLVTPTGTEMRNPTSETLRKVLEGDGRRLLVYEKGGKTRIIMPNEVRDIRMNGRSVFIPKGKDHQCGVWCDRC